MTLCPIAMAASCKACPLFAVCPLKGIIGDHVKPAQAQAKQPTDPEKEKPTVV